MTDDDLLRALHTCVAPCESIYKPYGRHAPECEWDIKEEAAERIESLLTENRWLRMRRQTGNNIADAMLRRELSEDEQLILAGLLNDTSFVASITDYPADDDNPELAEDAFELALQDARWSREEVQRVLFHIVTRYEGARDTGGDSELLRDAIRIGKQTLKDNNWWPEDA